MKLKKCSTCKQEKPISEFTKHKNRKDGLCGQCKECIKEYRERTKDEQKEWRENNKEKLRKKKREYYLENQEKIKARTQKYRVENADWKKEYDKQYLLKNRENLLQYKKEYYKENRKKLIEAHKEWERNKRKTDINFRLAQLLRHRLWLALNGNLRADKTLNLLGCSIEDFKKHLESKFKKGMNWNNYGRGGWHIDHIRPCASFDLSKEKEQRKCFFYLNLQPLWELENLKKGSKV